MLHDFLTEHRIFSLISYLASSLWLILYHSPPIFLFLPTFDYNPVSTVTRLRTCKLWFHSRKGRDFYLPYSLYSLRVSNSYCKNTIFQFFTEEFERFTWSLNEQENPLILQWTWLITFISTCLDNGIKRLWNQGVYLERMDLATWLHSATQHNVSNTISLKRLRNKGHIGSELKIIVNPCPLCTTKPLRSRKSVTAVLINK